MPFYHLDLRLRMQKKMQHSFITKIFLISNILKNCLIFSFLVNFSEFEKVISYAENLKSRNTKSKISIDDIFVYERKLSQLLKINNCFISSLCLFKTIKNYGHSAKVLIGVKKEINFSSHAWIETNEGSLLKDKKDKFEKIYEII